MASSYHPSLDDPSAWVPYRYIPSKVAAIIFLAAFSLTTALHLFQIVRRRTWYFIPLLIGGIFEAIGYLGRVLSSNNIWALGPFIMQSLLILIAPALLAASIYIILGRIILLVKGEKYSIIRQKWLTRSFVCGDIISFTIQCGGGGIQAIGNLNSMNIGSKIIIVGLLTQIVSFGFFIVVSITFQVRLLRDRRTDPGLYDLPWRKHLHAVYIGSSLILVRSVFRVVEYLGGNDGYLLRHEVFLYVFDATLMVLVMVLFNWVHPSEITTLSADKKMMMTTERGILLNSREGSV